MMLNRLKQNKCVKYFIKVFAFSVVIALMTKFIPYRVNLPLPTWNDLLWCDFPIIFLMVSVTLIFFEKRK